MLAPDDDLVAHDADLAAQRDEQPLAQDVQLADTVDALEQDGELVAAEPGDRVDGPDAGDQPGRRRS